MKVTKVPENGSSFVDYEVNGNVISFGDDEISANLKKKERDEIVKIDVCEDFYGGLTFAPAGARVYVAEIVIPAREYTEQQISNPNYDPEDESSQEFITERVPVPFDMDKVELALFELV